MTKRKLILNRKGILKSIIPRIEGSIRGGTAYDLDSKGFESGIYERAESGTVFYWQDPLGRRLIVYKRELYDLIFDLAIETPNGIMSERWDMDRLAKIGFKGRHLCTNLLFSDRSAGHSYHKEKSELVMVPDSAKPIYFYVEDMAETQSDMIELNSEWFEIDGELYYLSLLVKPYAWHYAINVGSNYQNVLMAEMSDRPYDPQDTYRERKTEDTGMELEL